MTIYKSVTGKKKILKLYDEQLGRLKKACSDKWISTSFGETHLIETGNLSGIPLLVFHGGNATTAYNLLACDFLMNDFHIYAVDTIGHPGKSAEVNLLVGRGHMSSLTESEKQMIIEFFKRE